MERLIFGHCLITSFAEKEEIEITALQSTTQRN